MIYIYEFSKYMHTSDFLNQVHSDMIKRFKGLQTRDLPEANILQNFLQQLKSTIQSGEYQQGFLPKAQMELLKQQLQSTKKGYDLSLLFVKNWGKNKGLAFEQDLEKLFTTIYDIYDINAEHEEENIGVGNITSSVENYINKKTKDVLHELGYKGAQAIYNSSTGEFSHWILPEVQQKTDVQGLNLELKISLTTHPELDKILQIINKATVSAKSYASIGKRKNQEKLDEIFPNLHIGKSNPYRAIMGSLNYAGYGTRTNNAVFYSGYHIIKKHYSAAVQVGIRFYQLRFMYELIGAGIINSAPVKFFIYNDPTGQGIYVDSTANIIYQVLTSNNAIENPYEAIVIKKSYMRNRKT